MTPVKKMALEYGREVPIFEMDSIQEAEIEKLRSTKPDLILVVAYGVILPKEALEIGSMAVNIHASLLPKFRGATPIETAILNDVPKSGITYMEMDEGMDTGPTYCAFEALLKENITFDELEFDLLQIAKESVLPTLEKIQAGILKATPQEPGATYTRKLRKEDAIINFCLPRKVVRNKINAMDSHVGARAPFQGQNIKLYKAELANVDVPMGHISTLDDGIYIGAQDGALKINQIQVPGKKKMNTMDFIRGNSLEGSFDGY